MKDEEYWFEQKRYGYGAGLPIAWQGWALLVGYVAVVLLGGLLIEWDPEVGLVGFLMLFIPATAALMYICAIKTRGGWRWRWGDDD